MVQLAPQVILNLQETEGFNRSFTIAKTIFTLLLICISPATFAATYTVTSTAFGTTGDGISLQWAITQANGSSGNTIAFNLGSSPPYTLTLGGSLPSITANNTTIDGTTQSGSAGASPKIIIDVNNSTIDGLVISGSGCNVYGLYIKGGQNGINCSNNSLTVGSATKRNVISGNTGGHGILVNTGGNNITAITIQGNYIGVEPTGTSALANGNSTSLHGIYITNTSGSMSGITIGGANSGEGNVISGNAGKGIYINKTGAVVSAVIKGNYIGVNAAGTSAIPNGSDGLYLTGQYATVGGNGTYEPNLISGNLGNGITVSTGSTNSTTTHWVFKGNKIGTNAAGTSALANSGYGLYVDFSSSDSKIYIGCSKAQVCNAGDGNLISGNASGGVYITSSGGTITVTATQNYIGTNAAATAIIANGGDGFTSLATSGNFVDSIGGTTSSFKNVISGNSGKGLNLSTNSSGNSTAVVVGNYIGTNPGGTLNLGNTSNGIYCSSSSSGGVLGRIGGIRNSDGNLIFYNGGEGVVINGSNSRVLISHNQYMCNSSSSGSGGISLTNGANNTIAAPVITSANATTVVGTCPSGDSVEVYLDDICSKTEGRYYAAKALASGVNWTATGTFNGCVTAIASTPSGTRYSSIFSNCVTTGVLPIELLSFTAHLNQGKTDLNWVTATETNNDYFTIEKSSNGIDFVVAMNVKGAGNSSVKIEYSVMDDYPLPNTSYYRLKQTDYDGKFSYSNIVAVNNKISSGPLIYPNPSSGGLVNIKMNGVEEREVLVVLYNSLGETAYSKLLINDSGNGILNATIEPESNLSPGVYYIVATSKNELFRKMLVVTGYK